MNTPLQLPDSVQSLLVELNSHQYEAYLVGGAVRDLILGRVPHDFDIATNADLNTLSSLFPSIIFHKTGTTHNTFTTRDQDITIDITPYDNPSLEEDLKRRDFTMNAIAYAPHCGIVDPFFGAKDIADKIIRLVNEDEQRIKEDPIRILRGIRLSAMLEYALSSNTERWMNTHKELLKSVAPERIQMEFSRFIVLPNSGIFLRKFVEIFEVFLPELTVMKGFEQHNPYHIYDVFEHTIRVVENVPSNLSLKLAALFHDSGKPKTYFMDEKGVGHFYGHPNVSADLARNRLTKLRYDEKTIEQVVRLVIYHDYPVSPERKRLKKLLHRFGVEDLDLLFSIKRADMLSQNPEHRGRMTGVAESETMIQDILRSGECVSLKQLAIDGDELIALGIPKGKQVGIMLDYLLQQVMRDYLANEKKPLMKAAEQYWDTHKR